ncbi:hypothetical protein QIS74_12942 [Colletotrichum tabaci]|uniref:Uncharacterized protein n=1 Tax=Colletotrichum tabaci TaxID=1209068 RepID=A0AAV9SUX7_9PEZI
MLADFLTEAFDEDSDLEPVIPHFNRKHLDQMGTIIKAFSYYFFVLAAFVVLYTIKLAVAAHEVDKKNRYKAPVGSGSAIHYFNPNKAIVTGNKDSMEQLAEKTERLGIFEANEASEPSSGKRDKDYSKGRDRPSELVFLRRSPEDVIRHIVQFLS